MLQNELQAVEGFSYEASKYGADNCGADWKAMAGLAANDRASIPPVPSPKIIRDFLASCFFTSDDIDAGVNAVDWPTLASAYAQQCLDDGTWSYMALGNYMFSEDFASADITGALPASGSTVWDLEALEYAGDNYDGETYKAFYNEMTGFGFSDAQTVSAMATITDWYLAAVSACEAYMSSNYYADYNDLFTYLSGESVPNCGYSDDQSYAAVDYWYQMAEYEATDHLALPYVNESREDVVYYLKNVSGYSFTDDMINLAADNQDYYQEACEEATYVYDHVMDYNTLVDILVNTYGFTYSEAEYGADTVDSWYDDCYYDAIAIPGYEGMTRDALITALQGMGHSYIHASQVCDALGKTGPKG